MICEEQHKAKSHHQLQQQDHVRAHDEVVSHQPDTRNKNSNVLRYIIIKNGENIRGFYSLVSAGVLSEYICRGRTLGVTTL
jgi:hypothetical protein